MFDPSIDNVICCVEEITWREKVYNDQHCYIHMYFIAAIIFNDVLICGPMAS